jgi:hypothetical protein
LTYVLFVLTGSEEHRSDLCDAVQLAADRTNTEIGVLRVDAERHRFLCELVFENADLRFSGDADTCILDFDRFDGKGMQHFEDDGYNSVMDAAIAAADQGGHRASLGRNRGDGNGEGGMQNGSVVGTHGGES